MLDGCCFLIYSHLFRFFFSVTIWNFALKKRETWTDVCLPGRIIVYHICLHWTILYLYPFLFFYFFIFRRYLQAVQTWSHSSLTRAVLLLSGRVEPNLKSNIIQKSQDSQETGKKKTCSSLLFCIFIIFFFFDFHQFCGELWRTGFERVLLWFF